MHRSRQLSFVTGMGLPPWTAGPKSDGGVGEETDRWAQGDVLWDLFSQLEEAA